MPMLKNESATDSENSTPNREFRRHARPASDEFPGTPTGGPESRPNPHEEEPVPPERPKRVLILGPERHCRRLLRRVGQSPWSDWSVVGFVDVGHGSSPSVPKSRSTSDNTSSRSANRSRPPAGVPILGGVERLDQLIERTGATDLIVALSGQQAAQISPRLTGLLRSRERSSSEPPVEVHWLDAFPAAIARPRPARRDPWSLAAKRAFDLTAGLLGLLVLTPLFLVVAVVIVASSGFPVFYTQERVGRHGRIFRMWKFRSMRLDAESQTGPIWASDNDNRCTRIGLWLRHTNIDELPQLWNVVRGDMSLVGPRPERPVFVEQFRHAIPRYDERHAVAGGMTGWAQVHGWRGRTSLRKRLQYDMDYIRRWSFWLDLRILLMTIQHIGAGKTQWSSDCLDRRSHRS